MASRLIAKREWREGGTEEGNGDCRTGCVASRLIAKRGGRGGGGWGGGGGGGGVEEGDGD